MLANFMWEYQDQGFGIEFEFGGADPATLSNVIWWGLMLTVLITCQLVEWAWALLLLILRALLAIMVAVIQRMSSGRHVQ